MAIDKVTGKRYTTGIKTLRDKKIEEEKKKEKALPKFDTNYEEELIKALFEEELKKKEEKKEILELAESMPDPCKVHKARPGEEWDVPITEEIKYFDPELSYEITGYRPITMEKGLDFDPEPFREMARIYEEKGHYTEFPEGSKPHRDLWQREMNRMRDGYVVGKYRITGDNYYFLNYYRMQVVGAVNAKAGEGRSESFPSFIAKQYEWFHYYEMAEKLHKDVCALKARGVE